MAKMLAAFVGGGLSIATGSGFAGLAQKTDVTALAAWMLLTAADRGLAVPPAVLPIDRRGDAMHSPGSAPRKITDDRA